MSRVKFLAIGCVSAVIALAAQPGPAAAADCEMVRALGLAIPEECATGSEEGVVVAPAQEGVKTRGLAIGSSMAPAVPQARTQRPAPVASRTLAPLGRAERVQPVATTATTSVPVPPRAKPVPAAAAHIVPLAEIREGLTAIRQMLAEVKAEQARLSREQEEIRDLIGTTRLREIGRLDGRIDQMTDLLERMMRTYGRATAPQ